MTRVRQAPDVPDGVSEEAATAFAQAFLEQWLTFSPANLEPKEQWFDGWEDQATPEFRNDMRRKADQMWSWTWNQSRKSCCVDFPDKPSARVGQEQAVAKVRLNRRTYDLFATAQDLKAGKGTTTDDLTFIVTMEVNESSFDVSAVEEVPADAALPEVK